MREHKPPNLKGVMLAAGVVLLVFVVELLLDVFAPNTNALDLARLLEVPASGKRMRMELKYILACQGQVCHSNHRAYLL